MFFGPRNTRNMGTLQLSETGLNLQTKHASCLLHRPFVFKLHPWVPQHGVICCLIHWWFSGGSWWFMVVHGGSWWFGAILRPQALHGEPHWRTDLGLSWPIQSKGVTRLLGWRPRWEGQDPKEWRQHQVLYTSLHCISIIYIIYIYILLIHVYNTYHIYLWNGNPPLGLKQFPSHRTWGQKSQNIWKNHASHAFIMHSLCIHYAFIMHSLCIHYALVMHSLCIHYAFMIFMIFMIFMYYEDCDVSISYEHDLGISR